MATLPNAPTLNGHRLDTLPTDREDAEQIARQIEVTREAVGLLYWHQLRLKAAMKKGE